MGHDTRLSHPQRGRAMAELLQHDITTEKEPQLPGGGWISNEETEVQRKSDLPRSQFLPAHPWPNHVPGAPWEDQTCSPGWPSQRSRR